MTMAGMEFSIPVPFPNVENAIFNFHSCSQISGTGQAISFLRSKKPFLPKSPPQSLANEECKLERAAAYCCTDGRSGWNANFSSNRPLCCSSQQ